MKKWCFFILLCQMSICLVAQETIALKVDDRTFRLSELEWFYHHSQQPGDFRLFLDGFVTDQLKVQDAIREGFDTLIAFKDKLACSERELLFHLMVEESDLTVPQQERVRIRHYLKPLPQNISRSAVNQAEQSMQSFYQQLKETDREEALQEAMNGHSVICTEEWIHRLDLPQDMENRIFSLKVQEISAPFFSPWGIHIVQVMERQVDATDFQRTDAEHSFRRKWREKKVEGLKTLHSYTVNEEGVSDLFLNGHTTEVLFSYKGRAYTGTDFLHFQAGHPYSLRKQLELFVYHSLLSDEATEHRESPEYRMTLLKYRDDLLIQAVTNKKIAPLQDDPGALQTYFEAHRSHYKWDFPRFRGVIMHTPTKKMGREVKKFLRKMPESEWKTALALTFDGERAPRICFEYGEYEIGQNSYVDKIIFKQGQFLPVEEYPFTTVVGKKVSIPTDWMEVRERVSKDYLHGLEISWLQELRKKSVVEINEEVLKTVNNH